MNHTLTEPDPRESKQVHNIDPGQGAKDWENRGGGWIVFASAINMTERFFFCWKNAQHQSWDKPCRLLSIFTLNVQNIMFWMYTLALRITHLMPIDTSRATNEKNQSCTGSLSWDIVSLSIFYELKISSQVEYFNE